MTPAMLMDLLGSLRGRLRAWSAAYGVGLVIAVAVAAFAAVALVDWTFHLSKWWRLLFALGTLGTLGWLIARHVARPLTARMPVDDIAGRIERRFPQFQDRLRSAVGFIERPTPDSPAMQQATIDQAVNLASALPIRDVLNPRPALRALGVGFASLVAIVLVVAVLDGATRSILLSRVFNPMSGAKWPKRVEIALLDPIASRVPNGGQVAVNVKLTRGDSAKVRPIVFFEDANGNRRQEFMTRGADGRYTVSVDARTDTPEKRGAMKLWVVAGDDRTEPASIDVLPKLGVEAATATFTPPAYVGAANPTYSDLASQQASGLVGSTVKLSVRFSKPIADVASVKLLPAEGVTLPELKWTAASDRVAEATFRLDETARFRVDAVDVDGFRVSGSGEYELVARPDAAPTVSIENPRRAEERTVESVVPLAALAEDDGGVRGLELVVSKIGGSAGEWTIPLVRDGLAVLGGAADPAWTTLDASGERTRYRAEYAWALAALADANLKPGDILEYGLRVTDNFQLDGQRHPPVDSSKLRITIISQEQLTNRVMDELRQVKSQVEQVKQQHDRTTAETDAFRGDVKEKPELDAADKTVAARLQQQLGSGASAAKAAAERLQELRRTMDENKSPSADLGQLSKDVAERLNATAEGSMKQSLQSLARAPAAPQADRAPTLDRSLEEQRQASAELAETLKRLEDVGSLNAAIDELQKALDAQRKLTEQSRDLAAKTVGKTPQQMAKEDRDQLAKIAAEQAALADKSQKAMDRLGKSADQLQKSDPDSANAMRQAQQQGQQKAVSQSQQQASKQMQQNQQRNARQSQQQAEVGLELMLNELRAAQTRKLSELQKKLAELQEQIKILVRRQSGHNLDNLNLQGADALNARKETVAALMTKSERKPGEPAAQLPRLLNGQGQTERNTRDIAKKAADVPDGAEPAARLTRAATMMERAAVYVKDKKLPDAYEPPQLDALATLEDAQRIIDEQKQKVDDDIEGQQQEAVRQAYVRIRGEQEKLADEVKRLEAARGDDGALNRVDAIRLGQLPAEQQKLVDDIAKVGENLAALKSVVYVWANKQISGQMGDAKAELGASHTGDVVQRAHVQTIADLTAMIDNLKVSPRERRFEQQQGGGGGSGQCKKPMPPEAELRLAKSLQQNLNDRTKRAADAAGPKAKPEGEEANAAVVALGRRQLQVRSLLGELLSAAGNGEGELGPVAPDVQPIDEERAIEQLDARELEAELLGGNPGAKDKEVDLRRIGDRMARVGTRLETDRDPGRVTQIVQQRILGDFDLLIEAARQQQAKPSNSNSQQKKPPQSPAPQPGAQQAQNKGPNSTPTGTHAASASSPGGVTGTAQKSGRELAEMSEEWGRISPRLRGPVLESRDETIVERYRRLIEDYTQAVSTEASGGGSSSNGGRP